MPSGRVAGTALTVVLSLAGSACSWWPSPKPETSRVAYTAIREEPAVESGPIEAGELRLRLERFADRYAEAMAWQLDKLATEAKTAEVRGAAMDQALAYANSAFMIASSRDPAVALLDMAVFVRLVRISLQDYWVPEVYGDRGRRVLEVARQLENEGWANSARMLSDEQRQELRDMIDEWRKMNPDRQYVELLRFGELSGQLSPASARKAGGLLGDVREAVAVAEKTTELVERALYYFERAPFLWTRHAQIAALDISNQPEMSALRADSERISLSAERLSLAVERLTSSLLDDSPEAALLEERLGQADASAQRLLGELRQTIVAGSDLAERVEVLLTRIDEGKNPEAEPFRIKEYQATAVEFTAVTRELQTLVFALENLLDSPSLEDQLPVAFRTASAETEQLIEYLIVLILCVIVATVIATVVAMLAYRYMTHRVDARAERRWRA